MILTTIAPVAARRYAPADGSSTVAYRFAANHVISAYMYGEIVADLRPCKEVSAVRTSLIAGGGSAAGSQRAYSLRSCAM